MAGDGACQMPKPWNVRPRSTRTRVAERREGETALLYCNPWFGLITQLEALADEVTKGLRSRMFYARQLPD